MKTLIVSYLPSGATSNTKKLVDAFLGELGTKSAVEHLDLIETPAPSFNTVSLAAYMKRNYRGEKLTPAEAKTLEHNDALVTQFKRNDVVVLAQPMHNFALPGPMKTYLDAIELNGETFRMGDKLMKGHKALTLYSAGGVYPAGKASAAEYPHWDTLTQCIAINFQFMGFDAVEVVGASLRDPTTQAAALAEARTKIQALVKAWY